MKRSLLTLVLFIAVSGTGWAQPYVTAKLGYARADFPLGPPYNGVIDDNALMYGVDAGMGFGEKWAVQVGANGYGSFDGLGTPCSAGTICAPVTIDIAGNDQTVYDAALARRFTIGNFRLFGKAGYYRAKLKTNISLPDADFSPDGVVLGVGLRWSFDSPWSISLEGERFDDNVSQLSVGFGWGWGDGDEREPEPPESR